MKWGPIHLCVACSPICSTLSFYYGSCICFYFSISTVFGVLSISFGVGHLGWGASGRALWEPLIIWLEIFGCLKTMLITLESLEKRDMGLIIMRTLVLWMLWLESLLCLQMHPICWTWIVITKWITRLLRRLCYTMDWKRTDDPHHLVQRIKSELLVTEPALHCWHKRDLVHFLIQRWSIICACHTNYVLIWAVDHLVNNLIEKHWLGLPAAITQFIHLQRGDEEGN